MQQHSQTRTARRVVDAPDAPPLVVDLPVSRNLPGRHARHRRWQGDASTAADIRAAVRAHRPVLLRLHGRAGLYELAGCQLRRLGSESFTVRVPRSLRPVDRAAGEVSR